MSETAEDFDAEVRSWEEWKANGEPGDCPMCGAELGKAHRRNFCFAGSPTAGRPSPFEEVLLAMPEDERTEALRPWEPWLIDRRWIRWIIADFMGLDSETEVDKAKVEEWLKDHGQTQNFAVCLKCGADAVYPIRERFEAPTPTGGKS